MTLSENLSRAIETWLACRSARSLNLLSRLSGVSYPTSRRIALGEVEPSAEVTAAIASVVLSRVEALALLKRYFPSFRPFLVDVDYQCDKAELLRFYGSREYFRIILLAGSSTGTTEEELAFRFGESALPYFKDLIHANAIHYRNGSYYFESEIRVASKEAARQQLSYMIELCRRDLDTQAEASAAHALWGSLNNEAVLRCNQKIADCYREIQEEVDRHENHGEILWIGGMLNSILKNEDKLL